jgi:tetratricopeptide (TPR) repeat protein
MKTTFIVIAALALLSAPAFADQKIDEAVAKANEQLQKGKPEEALKTLQKLASQNPGPEGQLPLGRFQEKTGSLDDALATYAKAAEGAGPAKADALAALAGLQLRTGPAKTALATAEQAVQAQSSPNTLATLARVQARLDPVKALATADQAVAAGATAAVAQDARGVALLAQGRNDDGAAAFRKALELDPKLARARVGLAMTLNAQKKGTEAVAEARKVTSEDPNLAEGHAALGLAILAENPKAWNDAIAEAQDAAFKNPKSPEIQMAVAKIFETDNRFDQAAEAYKKALGLDPNFAVGRAALINAQFRKGDLDGALAEALKLAADAPTSGDAQAQVGELLLRKGDFPHAIAPLEKAVTLLSGSAEANYYLGKAYFSTGRVKDSLAPYKRAAELAPSNLEYRSTYGLVLGMNERYAEGAAELQKVVSSPGYKDTAGFTNLGYVYRNMTPPKVTESIAAYKKALELDPKNAQAALGLGWAYSAAKSWDDCIAAYEKLIQLDPKFTGAAYTGMAWAHASKRDFGKARELLNKAGAAGGGDGRLDALLDRVEARKKKGIVFDDAAAAEAEKERQAALQAQAKTERVNQSLNSPNPATRIGGLKDLVALGPADAVPMLTWMLVNDKDYSVRTAVANALGGFGPAARKAVPHLKAIATQQPPVNLNPSQADMDQEMRFHDFQKACRDALAKIGE